MLTVTTCNRAGFEQYGSRTLAGLENWPTEVVWYTEGFDLPEGRAKGLRNETLTKLAEFKAKFGYYRTPDWRYDVVRFANKAYAFFDALRDYDDVGVWMDADIVTLEPLPAEYLRSLLPEGTYIALFQREGVHSETGLFLVDCRHPRHKQFMDTYISWYEQGTFRDAHEWHDCVCMDATVKAFQRMKAIEVHNLSGANKGTSHPMALHPIARYIDHCKGTKRKELGYSPERRRYMESIGVRDGQR